MVATIVFVAVSITETLLSGVSNCPASVTYTRKLQFGGIGKNGSVQKHRQHPHSHLQQQQQQQQRQRQFGFDLNLNLL
ncbi:hypothetical protein [Solibacillus cecembensis]|uniref:hypothetical protein n=1 Tax=Solibacillus cecembensis TaxID=459347 RepID=UPI003D003E59